MKQKSVEKRIQLQRLHRIDRKKDFETWLKRSNFWVVKKQSSSFSESNVFRWFFGEVSTSLVWISFDIHLTIRWILWSVLLKFRSRRWISSDTFADRLTAKNSDSIHRRQNLLRKQPPRFFFCQKAPRRRPKIYLIDWKSISCSNFHGICKLAKTVFSFIFLFPNSNQLLCITDQTRKMQANLIVSIIAILSCSTMILAQSILEGTPKIWRKWKLNS